MLGINTRHTVSVKLFTWLNGTGDNQIKPPLQVTYHLNCVLSSCQCILCKCAFLLLFLVHFVLLLFSFYLLSPSPFKGNNCLETECLLHPSQGKGESACVFITVTSSTVVSGPRESNSFLTGLQSKEREKKETS